MNDPELDQLLQRARGIAPRAGNKARLRSRILAGAAAGSASTVAVHAVGASKVSVLVAALGKSGGGLALSVLACVGGGVALGLLVIGPAFTNRDRLPAAQAPKAAAAIEPSAAAATSAPGAATQLVASAKRTDPPSSPARSASAASGVPSIERETALLAAAQRALGRNDAAAALGLLDAYEAEFPGGALAEEASAARTVSWCSLGRKAEGLRALGKFRAAYPGSPLLARALAACSTIGNHDDFELESVSPSTQSSKRPATAGGTGRDLK